MIQKLNIHQYYGQFHNLPLIDVRSPGEYRKGHIPGAFNIPIFSDSERAEVGTMYVQRSREKAIELGYKFVTPKLSQFVIESEEIAPNKEVVVHCWRGGMRSASFAQHLADNGFQKVYVIEGGYKAYRNYVLGFFMQPFQLRILGGYTGSGKTHILENLRILGQQVINLEQIANHKGSAFGGIDQPKQPTVEQFENNLFEEFRHLDIGQPIWVEDESHNIGGVKIPIDLFNQIRTQTVYFLNIPQQERVKHLVEEYGHCDPEMLEESITRISKRLGGLAVKEALDFLSEKNYREVAQRTLHYYDKSYLKGISFRDSAKVIYIDLESTDHEKNARSILNYLKDNGRD